MSDHKIINNELYGNDSFGLLVAGFCTTLQVTFGTDCTVTPPVDGDPEANRNLYAGNQFSNNGGNPDPLFLAVGFPPNFDIFYVQSPFEIIDPNGDLNCFEDNGNALGLGIDPSTFTPIPLPTAGCNL